MVVERAVPSEVLELFYSVFYNRYLVVLYCYCIVVFLLYCYHIVVVLLLYCYCIVVGAQCVLVVERAVPSEVLELFYSVFYNRYLSVLYCYCIVVFLLYCYHIVVVLLLYCYCIVVGAQCVLVVERAVPSEVLELFYSAFYNRYLAVLYCYCIVVFLLYCDHIVVVLLLYCCCIVIILLLYCYCIVVGAQCVLAVERAVPSEVLELFYSAFYNRYLAVLYCYCIVVFLLYCDHIVVVLLLYCCCIVIILLLYCYCIVVGAQCVLAVERAVPSEVLELFYSVFYNSLQQEACSVATALRAAVTAVKNDNRSDVCFFVSIYNAVNSFVQWCRCEIKIKKTFFCENIFWYNGARKKNFFLSIFQNFIFSFTLAPS